MSPRAFTMVAIKPTLEYAMLVQLLKAALPVDLIGIQAMNLWCVRRPRTPLNAEGHRYAGLDTPTYLRRGLRIDVRGL